MSVNPIDTSSTSAYQQSAATQSNWESMLSSVSGTLGLSTTSLQQELESGESLSSIAQTQGVSQSTLLQSISTALTQSGSSASGSQLQQVASNIASRTGGHHHHSGGSGSSQSFSSTLLQALEASNSTTNPASTDPLTADAAQLLDPSSSTSSSTPGTDPSSTSSTSSTNPLLTDLTDQITNASEQL
jgi:transposase-like protein